MYRLLIIDDEEIIRTGMRSIIKKGLDEEFEFFEAENGKDAIEVINKFEPEIIFTDIRMPYIDGLEVIDWVYNNKQKKPAFIILSGYDDFNYAKQAIKYGVREYLLKPISRKEVIELLNKIVQQLNGEKEQIDAELLKNIRNQEGIELLKEKVFNAIITNVGFDKDKIQKSIFELGINFPHDNFKVMAIDYSKVEENRLDVFTNIDKFSLKQCIDKSITNISIKYWSFYDDEMRLIILLCGNDEFTIDIQVKKIYKQIKLFLMDTIEVRTFAGLGNDVNRIEDIEKSYVEAINAVMHKIFHIPEDIIEFKDINIDEDKYKNLSLYFPKIAEKTELRLKMEISKILDEMFQVFTSQDISVVGIMNFYNDINRYLYNYFSQRNIDFSVVFDSEEHYFNSFEYFWSIDEIKVYIRNYIFKICDIISAYKSMNPNKKIVDKIIRYLWENYNKNINLNSISETFGKNSSYLSVLFKQETNKNFVDFLTDIRMEKAKEMLAKNNISIHEISAAVGYPNSKYFYKVFNKAVGISPKKYKNECL